LRPLYETESDSSAEAEVAKAYGEHVRMRPVKRSPQDYLDYDMVSLLSDRVLVNIEIKVRKPQYKSLIEQKGYMLSAEKWKHIQRTNKETGLAVLVVAFDYEDHYEIYTLAFGRNTYPDILPVMGGRTKKQRDAADIEPVVYIPWDRFWGIGNSNKETR
tara:strand:+ start:3058 stop:3534 length:477 start_codon:yes stop_codon:yes gene_type:complete